MILKPNQEIIGILHAVEEDDNNCNLHFSCNVKFRIPSTAVSNVQLITLVGERIGILNIGHEFFIRVIKSR